MFYVLYFKRFDEYTLYYQPTITGLAIQENVKSVVSSKTKRISFALLTQFPPITKFEKCHPLSLPFGVVPVILFGKLFPDVVESTAQSISLTSDTFPDEPALMAKFIIRGQGVSILMFLNSRSEI